MRLVTVTLASRVRLGPWLSPADAVVRARRQACHRGSLTRSAGHRGRGGQCSEGEPPAPPAPGPGLVRRLAVKSHSGPTTRAQPDGDRRRHCDRDSGRYSVSPTGEPGLRTQALSSVARREVYCPCRWHRHHGPGSEGLGGRPGPPPGAGPGGPVTTSTRSH